MSLFVRAKKGKTKLNLLCPGVLETTVDIGSIHKKIDYQSPQDEAKNCKKHLVRHGWEDVRIVDTSKKNES